MAFVEIDGQYVLANPTMLAIQQARDAFSGFAEANSLETEEDVAAMINEHRHNKNT